MSQTLDEETSKPPACLPQGRSDEMAQMRAATPAALGGASCRSRVLWSACGRKCRPARRHVSSTLFICAGLEQPDAAMSNICVETRPKRARLIWTRVAFARQPAPPQALHAVRMSVPELTEYTRGVIYCHPSVVSRPAKLGHFGKLLRAPCSAAPDAATQDSINSSTVHPSFRARPTTVAHSPLSLSLSKHRSENLSSGRRTADHFR